MNRKCSECKSFKSAIEPTGMCGNPTSYWHGVFFDGDIDDAPTKCFHPRRDRSLVHPTRRES